MHPDVFSLRGPLRIACALKLRSSMAFPITGGFSEGRRKDEEDLGECQWKSGGVGVCEFLRRNAWQEGEWGWMSRACRYRSCRHLGTTSMLTASPSSLPRFPYRLSPSSTLDPSIDILLDYTCAFVLLPPSILDTAFNFRVCICHISSRVGLIPSVSCPPSIAV